VPGNAIVLGMVYAIGLLALAVSLQLLISYRWPRWFRVVTACLASISFVAASIWLLAINFAIVTLGIALVSLYGVVNMLRVIVGRSDERYLRTSVAYTSMWLGLAQVILIYSMLGTFVWFVPREVYVLALAGLQLVVAIAILLSVRRQLRTTLLPKELEDISDGQLPTVTVAVPVRNEAGLLEACLTSILASNYPKLEVLAFDDHSHDKTPEIIRSFAHSGVRFIRTAEPAGGWLAKNQAYDSLVQAANGDYILFMGADVRLAPRSIRQLVSLLSKRNKHMLAVLPLNRAVTRVPVLQAMRYYWEMAPPRRLFRRPPVLSSCWIIERKALKRYGGFAAVRQSMSSEAHLARSAVKDSDSYSFIRSDERLGVTSEKDLGQQRSTARLRRYPQVHRRPELVLMYTVGQLVLLLAPLGVVAIAILVYANWLVAALALAALSIHMLAFGLIQRPIFPRASAWRAYAAFLTAIVSDIWYLNQSMVLYEFGTLTWKGRDVTQPVMGRNKTD
jgi:hypothetical protein